MDRDWRREFSLRDSMKKAQHKGNALLWLDYQEVRRMQLEVARLSEEGLQSGKNLTLESTAWGQTHLHCFQDVGFDQSFNLCKLQFPCL